MAAPAPAAGFGAVRFAVLLGDGFGADFLGLGFFGVAAFLAALRQPVPQTRQDRSPRPLLVSHLSHRQSPGGRAGAGFRAAGAAGAREPRGVSQATHAVSPGPL
ncbi:hypothetical protein [Streptomyces sp. NPDC001889]